MRLSWNEIQKRPAAFRAGQRGARTAGLRTRGEGPGMEPTPFVTAPNSNRSNRSLKRTSGNCVNPEIDVVNWGGSESVGVDVGPA